MKIWGWQSIFEQGKVQSLNVERTQTTRTFKEVGIFFKCYAKKCAKINGSCNLSSGARDSRLSIVSKIHG
jgi:hypothetical protein